jgi:hypothetical protein
MILKAQIRGYDVGRVFMDAGSGINLIYARTMKAINISLEWLQPTFITPYGVFCYQVMPFSLKNAGATYQRMMQNCLGSQIGRNIQVYIDDMVITTQKKSL